MLRILYFAKTIKNKQFWQLIRILYFAKTYFKLKFWLTIKIYPQPKGIDSFFIHVVLPQPHQIHVV